MATLDSYPLSIGMQEILQDSEANYEVNSNMSILLG